MTYKALLVIALVALSACSRPTATVMTGTFETLSLGTIETPGCVFRANDTPQNSDEILFATYFGNLDHIAVARFKGETIKLVPKEVPDLTTDGLDITYEVIDYLKWQVRLQVEMIEPTSRPPILSGTLTLVGTDVVSTVTGLCGR